MALVQASVGAEPQLQVCETWIGPTLASTEMKFEPKDASTPSRWYVYVPKMPRSMPTVRSILAHMSNESAVLPAGGFDA